MRKDYITGVQEGYLAGYLDSDLKNNVYSTRAGLTEVLMRSVRWTTERSIALAKYLDRMEDGIPSINVNIVHEKPQAGDLEMTL